MKKLINLAFVVSMALIACSCGNSDEQQGESEEKTVTETQTETVVEEEKYFSYQLLESRNLYVRYNFMDSKCLTDDGCFLMALSFAMETQNHPNTYCLMMKKNTTMKAYTNGL